MKPAVAAAGALLWLVWRPVALNYDTAYALVWGRGLLSGELPDHGAPGAPTPHPLLTLTAAAVAPAGDLAYVLLPVAGCLAWALMLYAVFRLGAEAGTAVAGAVAAGVLATSGVAAALGATAAKDVPYVALLAAAGTLALREGDRARLGAAALLAVAGLLRPEAWLLAGAHWLVCGRGLRHLAVAAVAPALWLLADLVVTGDPLFSFRFTRDAAAALGRPTGAGGAGRALVVDLPALVTWPVAVAGTGAALLSVRRRAWRVPAVAFALLAAAVLVQGLAGLPVTGRLLLGAGAALAVLFGLAVASLPRGAAVLALLALLVALPWQIDRYADLRTALRLQGRAQHDLRALLTGPAGDRLRACRNTVLRPGPAGAEQVAAVAFLVHRGDTSRITVSEPARAGIVLARGVAPPAGFDRVAGNRRWTAFTRGC